MQVIRVQLFSVVRYSNVVGSRGISVIPLFISQRNSPSSRLTITNPDMTRFLITLKDSVDFVVKCFESMVGGELFVPKILLVQSQILQLLLPLTRSGIP